MKIAHISDLHINTSGKEHNADRLYHLLRLIIEQKADHLIITGDISDDADERDFALLRKMLQHFDLLHSDRVSIVIGNHDIFGGVQYVEDIFHFPERCRTTDYEKSVALFNSYFTELFENCIYRSDSNNYPYAKFIDSTLLVGINSISKYSPIRNPFASNGFVDVDQLAEIKLILEKLSGEAEHIIVAMHHHFHKLTNSSNKLIHSIWQTIEKRTMKLHKRKRLIQLFADYSIELVLHGHIHENKLYDVKGLKALNSGGSIKSLKKDHISYNILTRGNKKYKPHIEKLLFTDVHNSHPETITIVNQILNEL